MSLGCHDRYTSKSVIANNTSRFEDLKGTSFSDDNIKVAKKYYTTKVLVENKIG